MTELKPITIWERLNHDSKKHEHNHIEDGHSEILCPKSIDAVQAAGWGKGKWKKEHGYLIDNVVYTPSSASQSLPIEAVKLRIAVILTGIDKESCGDHPEPWWETSTGAEFGAAKLAELFEYLDSLNE